ncbi:MAG: hypothetical protein RIR48_3321 [Bacteroidota bacterium]|jgi:hypothetical protein
MITLNSKLTKGKYKGKSINEIKDHFYICWIFNNWKEQFAEDVIKKYSYSAYIAKQNNYGNQSYNNSITLDDCWQNL